MGENKAKKGQKQKPWKTYVFEGCEAREEGQVGPKMAPSWAKMGSGRELKAIFGHLERKMAIKVY